LEEHRSPKPVVGGSNPSRPAKIFEEIMINKIKDFLTGVKLEMKKVSWPTFEELKNSTAVVIVFSIIVSIFLFVVDLVLTKTVNFII
jgi:preprotein translocase subunit SecE